MSFADGTRLARMEGHAVISHDVLASYAADAAREVDGVHALVDGPRRHKGVRVVEGDGAMTLEVHVSLDWGGRLRGRRRGPGPRGGVPRPGQPGSRR